MRSLSNMWAQNVAKAKNHIKEPGGRNARKRPRTNSGHPGTPGTFGPIYVEIQIQGGKCLFEQN